MRFSILLFLICISNFSIAHNGRLASDGCHNDKAKGVRHCHAERTSTPKSTENNLKEADYVNHFCTGLIEQRLTDNTRVDCMTDTHAIEYDFAKKWAEAVGQSLHYANMTDLDAGIVLIIKKPSDQKYIDRVGSIIDRFNLPISVDTVQHP